jgi:hypothetical protein
MKERYLNALFVFAAAIFLSGVMWGSPSRAEFTLIDRADAWFFYTQRGVGSNNAACQVVSCVRGVCGSGARGRTQFSLYDARDGRGIMPEFISPRRAMPSQTATLELNGQVYVLQNPFKSPQFYLQVSEVQDAVEIVKQLQNLETQDRLGKFFVVDPQGRRHQFTVRGITESLSRMNRRCTPRG